MTVTRKRPMFGPMVLTALVTALVARKDLRDRLIESLKETASSVSEVAAHAYEDRVQPLAENVGSRVQEVAQDVLHSGSERLGSLTDTVHKGVQSGLETAQQTAQQAAGTVQGLVSSQVEGGRKALAERARTAKRAAEVAAREGRKEAMRAMKRARKVGEAALSKAERRSLKQAARLGLVKERPRTDPVAASLLTVGIVGVGGYLLARSPRVRQGILDTVRSVSPQAADALHSAGRQVRNVIGSVWLERTPEGDDVAAPAAPRGGQGASAYGSPEPGSDAARRAGQEPSREVPPAEGPVQNSGKGSGSTKH